jgi:hypothetical protein
MKSLEALPALAVSLIYQSLSPTLMVNYRERYLLTLGPVWICPSLLKLVYGDGFYKLVYKKTR